MSSIIKDSLKKILYQASKPILGRVGKDGSIIIEDDVMLGSEVHIYMYQIIALMI